MRHERFVHGNAVPVIKTVEKGYRYPKVRCPGCGEKFGMLKNHMRHCKGVAENESKKA